MRGNLLILVVNIVKGKAALFDIFFPHKYTTLFVWWHLPHEASLLFVRVVAVRCQKEDAVKEEVCLIFNYMFWPLSAFSSSGFQEAKTSARNLQKCEIMRKMCTAVAFQTRCDPWIGYKTLW